MSESKALQKADATYRKCYEEAKGVYLTAGTSALRMEIGKLGTTIASLESSLNTQKSLPSQIVGLSSLFVSSIVLMYSLYCNVNTVYDLATALRGVFGEDAERYLRDLDVGQIANELLSKNETIMLWACMIFVVIVAAIVASAVPYFGLNKRKREIDECRIQRATYQQLLEEVLRGEVTEDDLMHSGHRSRPQCCLGDRRPYGGSYKVRRRNDR